MSTRKISIIAFLIAFLTGCGSGASDIQFDFIEFSIIDNDSIENRDDFYAYAHQQFKNYESTLRFRGKDEIIVPLYLNYEGTKVKLKRGASEEEVRKVVDVKVEEINAKVNQYIQDNDDWLDGFIEARNDALSDKNRDSFKYDGKYYSYREDRTEEHFVFNYILNSTDILEK